MPGFSQALMELEGRTGRKVGGDYNGPLYPIKPIVNMGTEMAPGSGDWLALQRATELYGNAMDPNQTLADRFAYGAQGLTEQISALPGIGEIATGAKFATGALAGIIRRGIKQSDVPPPSIADLETATMDLDTGNVASQKDSFHFRTNQELSDTFPNFKRAESGFYSPETNQFYNRDLADAAAGFPPKISSEVGMEGLGSATLAETRLGPITEETVNQLSPLMQKYSIPGDIGPDEAYSGFVARTRAISGPRMSPEDLAEFDRIIGPTQMAPIRPTGEADAELMKLMAQPNIADIPVGPTSLQARQMLEDRGVPTLRTIDEEIANEGNNIYNPYRKQELDPEVQRVADQLSLSQMPEPSDVRWNMAKEQYQTKESKEWGAEGIVQFGKTKAESLANYKKEWLRRRR